MQSVHRRIIKTLEHRLPGLKVTLVRQSKHVVADFHYDGRTFRTAMASSPKNPDHTVWNACAEVCKGLGVPKVKV